ncbi:aTPase AAA family [Clostridium sp. CAG:1024]|jgi:putative ATPase|nr:replication-associated recombination protein A [Clostridium sp.]MDD7139336.1 replication-associated recombination protein A [Clostridium sp.]MDY6082221.1 replication-associated recombination protein A [Eubacteriales bacterium]CCX41155.1 aTPase AAA family [Clostridium sp. CAG:1024]
MEETLFRSNVKNGAPLADRMRPRTLDEFVGQKHIVGEGKLLRRAILSDRLQSTIFFGPPGTGKTTLASIIATSTGAAFQKLNAVSSGVKELREILDAAAKRLALTGQPTYLLLDECHRWSKAQSDSLLPALEKGTVRFIGSTTENPMIAMTSAIVSRCRVFEFYPLTTEDILSALTAALADEERGFGKQAIEMEGDALLRIASIANGDCRNALNALELAVLTTSPAEDGIIHITPEIAAESSQRKVMKCDEQLYYDMLSAFCKSLRGGDSDAALAWFARLIYAGVDARIIARRLIAHASEDIGLANPQAMVQAVTAAQALELIGMPEAGLSLSQAIIFLCESPKSNAVVLAKDAALADAATSYDEPVPVYLRDTSYRGAKKLGHGKGYKYPHDYPGHWVQQDYMPQSLKGKRYYEPSGMGAEAKILENHIRRDKARRGEPLD